MKRFENRREVRGFRYLIIAAEETCQSLRQSNEHKKRGANAGAHEVRVF
ncbi:MAG: hypothetical protein ACRENK_12105 [Gemmatimonadaceae bacterium]